MKQYLADQLLPADFGKLKQYLDEKYDESPMDGLYWIPMDPAKTTRAQQDHKDCQPHVFALHLEEESLSCEFLVRTLSSMRCDCMGYADPNQALYIMGFMDDLLKELDIVC